MSQERPNDDELDKLLYRWCEGDITPEEGVRLESLMRDDPAARQYFLDYVQLDAQLRWEVGDGEPEQHVPCPAAHTVAPAPAVGGRGWRGLLAGVLAASIAGAIVLGFLLVRARSGLEDRPLPPSPPLVATVRSVAGSVEIVAADSTVRAAAGGDTVYAGESIGTGPEEGGAIVEYQGGAVIEFGHDTLLQFSNEPGPAAVLRQRRGTVELTVGKRPAGQPLVLKTPQGEIRVLGTRFRSLVGGDATRIEIDEGRVEVTRASDQQKTEVVEGDYILIGPTSESLAVRASPIMLTEASRVLEDKKSEEPADALSFTRDGGSLVTGGFRGSVKQWNLKTGDIRNLSPPHEDHVRSVVLSPDGRTFATGGEDQCVRFWDAATGAPREPAIEKARYAWPLAFCEGGSLLATTGMLPGPRGVLRFWRTDTAQHVADVGLDANRIDCLAVSPDGHTLAAGDIDGTLVICDSQEPRQQKSFRAHEGAALSIAISPDGRWLASGGRDGTVKLWDTADWRLQATLKGHAKDVVSMAFCPDRMLLAASDNQGLTRLWEVRTGQEVVVISWPRHREARTVFSPDGRTVVTAGTRGIITFWDLPEDVRDSSAVWQTKK